MVKKSDFVFQEEERRKTIKEQLKYHLAKHKMNMKELEFQRETNKILHENNMTRQRIKTAEIRKAQTRKDFLIRTGLDNYKGGGR